MRSVASYIRVGLVAVIAFLVLYFLGTNDQGSAFMDHPWLWSIFGFIVIFHVAAEACVGALERVLYLSLKPEAKERYDRKRTFAKAEQFKWFKETYSNLLGSKPVEEEGEIILDHEYDGIRELDNKLPPWWVYGFYATIVFAAIYLIRFEVFEVYTQEEEYEEAVAEAQIEIEEYKRTAKNLIDVNTVQVLTELSDLNTGKSIFEGNCAACHKVTGAGGIGPNLTDDHWILGGGIKNVFNTISEGGRSGKGMVSWKADLKPYEMAQVASYVLSLHGSNPPEAKAPEGEIWVDPNAPVEDIKVEVKDSTDIKVIIEDEPVTEDLIKDSE